MDNVVWKSMKQIIVLLISLQLGRLIDFEFVLTHSVFSPKFSPKRPCLGLLGCLNTTSVNMASQVHIEETDLTAMRIQ